MQRFKNVLFHFQITFTYIHSDLHQINDFDIKSFRMNHNAMSKITSSEWVCMQLITSVQRKISDQIIICRKHDVCFGSISCKNDSWRLKSMFAHLNSLYFYLAAFFISSCSLIWYFPLAAIVSHICICSC